MNSYALRQELFDENVERLTEMAVRAINVLCRDPKETVLVAIHVDDPEWTDLANHLMPNTDWQQYRALGQKVVARGIVDWGLAELIREVVPSLSDAIGTPPPSGHLYAFVLDGGGASIYAVPHSGLNG